MSGKISALLLVIASLSWQATTNVALASDGLASLPVKHHETDYGSWSINEGSCKISCVNPHATCGESEKVLESFKAVMTAYSKSDWKTAAQYMSEGCTTFDETRNKMISGRENVISHLERSLKAHASTSDTPLLSYTVEHPYAEVNGDTAVVTYNAFKVFGGKNPHTLKSLCTDIFVKENDVWKKMHYRSHWVPVETAKVEPTEPSKSTETTPAAHS